MKKCCKKTFKNALEEVVFTIEKRDCKSIKELLDTIKYAISELERLDKTLAELKRIKK